MNTLINTTMNTNTITISSLEIAQITGKRHDHVMTDIQKMLSDLNLHAPEFSGTYQTERGNTYKCFNLPKRETLILMSGYDIVMRAKIIDRWEELETNAQQQVQPVLPNFLDPAAAAIAWASEYQAKQEALKQVAALEVYVQEAAPAVALHAVISNSDGAITMGEFAAVVKERTGLGRNNMFKRLRGLNILQPNNTPYARFSKYFKTVETYRGGNIVIVTLVRVDSQEYLINRLV